MMNFHRSDDFVSSRLLKKGLFPLTFSTWPPIQLPDPFLGAIGQGHLHMHIN
jgi:hypothetical protein